MNSNKNRQEFIAVLACFFFLFMSFESLAIETPTLPTIIKGTAMVDNEPLPIGTTITATIEGNLLGESNTTKEGQYAIAVGGGLENKGKPIVLYVDGIKAETNVTWSSGTIENANLAVEKKDNTYIYIGAIAFLFAFLALWIKKNIIKVVEFMKKTLVGFAFALIISASFAYGLDMPAIPDKFFGTVKADGANVTAGNIIITVGSATDTYSMAQDGYYDLYVKKGVAGDIIKFYINGALYGTKTRAGGTIENYDLSYTTLPSAPPAITSGGGGGGGSSSSTNFCGDKKCSAPEETSQNCPSDCTAVKTESIKPCSESWTCAQWSECTGTMERKCTDANSCNTVLQKPEEKKSCTPEQMQDAKALIDSASQVNSSAAKAFLNDARTAYIDGNYTLAQELAQRALDVDSAKEDLMPTALALSQTSTNGGIITAIAVILAVGMHYFRKKR